MKDKRYYYCYSYPQKEFLKNPAAKLLTKKDLADTREKIEK